ncbi:MAG: adenosine deaminase [Prolixibacteraceae bacterium]|nr:adenosine deaminase [Prolixibacteraceae bacterium]
MTDLHRFICSLPKAELHLHIEGTLEPELIFKLAERNSVELKYDSVEALRNAYQFDDLQDFLDIYYAGSSVLLREQDFYDLTWAYLLKAKENNVVHTEVMFDPQSHTSRGVPFSAVIGGIYRALTDGYEKLGISFKLILSFLRHLTEEDGFKTLAEATPFQGWITAVGLDSSERNYPPDLFANLFEMAQEMGFLTVVHAGEEGPPENIWAALDLLKASRIDHGTSALEDPDLVDVLGIYEIPLTSCPLSNLKLKVIRKMEEHPLKEMMERGIKVTVNSDDPAYFGGYLNDNYIAVADALQLSREEIVQLVKNSFEASFITDGEKRTFLKKVEEVAGVE